MARAIVAGGPVSGEPRKRESGEQSEGNLRMDGVRDRDAVFDDARHVGRHGFGCGHGNA